MIELVKAKAVEAGLKPEPVVTYDQFSIVECEYHYKDICVAKYILISTKAAFLQQISVTDDVLKSFETKYIEPLYFQTKGDLRWNIYCVFVLSDDEFAKIPEMVRSTIEHGKRYARKIVASVSSFSDSVPVAKVKMDSVSAEIPDPKNDWVTVLESQRLEFCLEAFANAKVNAFIEDNDDSPRTMQQLEDVVVAENQAVRSHRLSIDRIVMGGAYRNHCFAANQELSFGSVNLFEGANGSGKTSIFEGIEAAFTGLIQRHELAKKGLIGTDIWDGKLYLNNGECFKSIPQERIRKERESFYYQNKEKRIAKLNQLFHQYNYFSSEATFQFCFSDGEPQYANEFSRIIFGEDLITTEKNLRRYKEEFELRRKQTVQEITQLTEDMKIAEQESVINADDISASATGLKGLLTKVFYSTQHFNASDSNSNIEHWLIATNNNLINLDALTSPLDSMETEGITSFKSVDEKLIEQRKKVEERSGEIKNCMEAWEILREQSACQERQVSIIKKAISEAISHLNRIETAQSKLSEVLPIITNMGAGKERLALESEINSIVQKIKSIEHIKTEITLSDVNRLNDFEMDELDTKKSEALKQNDIIIVRIEQNSKQIASIETHSKALDSIISQIKVFGQRYLQEMPHATSCPLCSAEYGSYDLLKVKIEGAKSSNLDNLKELIAYKQKLNDQRKQLLHNIAEIEKDQSMLNKLSRLVDFACAEGILSLDIKPYRRSIKGMYEILYDAVMENEKPVCNEYERCSARIKQLEAQGILIDAIKKAKSYFEQDEVLSEYTLNAKDSIEDMLQQEKEKILSNKVGLERRLVSEEEMLIDLNQRIKNILVHVDELKRTNEQASILIKRHETWIGVFNRMQEAGICISKDYSSVIWRSYLKRSIEEIATIREKIEKSKQREQKQLLLRKQKKRRERLQEIKKRCNSALSIINNLKPLSDYSNAYLRENFKQIEALFFKLHMPNEFVKLGLNDGKIVAYRRSSTIPVHSFQMSAGQRTALALAVFFQLHMSMATAPNFVLLDEPVANVDDLNLLGLLDFLKQLSISSNTQIFMTTANPNVAKLFMRKFSFEGDNLHYFKLKRLKPEHTNIEIIRLGLENSKDVS